MNPDLYDLRVIFYFQNTILPRDISLNGNILIIHHLNTMHIGDYTCTATLFGQSVSETHHVTIVASKCILRMDKGIESNVCFTENLFQN